MLRFWPTGYALMPDDDSNGSSGAVPIWTGSLIHERLRRGSWPFNVLTASPEEDGSALDLAAAGEPMAWRVLTVPGGARCEGRPVTLIASQQR